MADPVFAKLSLFQRFSTEERGAIEQMLKHDMRTVTRGNDIASQEGSPFDVNFVLDGLLARVKYMPDGRRQMLAVMLPGDSCDFGISLLDKRDHAVVAVADSRIARIPDIDLQALGERYPRVRAALHWELLIELAISREWTLNVGQRSATERAAHFFCELYYRLRPLGLAENRSYRLPITQGELAEALGMSSVHVNRSLQELRHRGFIAFGDGRLTILDLSGLVEHAKFEAAYLHQIGQVDADQRI